MRLCGGELLAAIVGVLALPLTAAPQTACSEAALAVQVLGSGGPFAGTTRASTGYLLWRDGRAVAMIDAGGGTFLRFGEAGARLNDLSVLAISHLHPDHVTDLPGLLWLSDAVRDRPLVLVGPSAGGVFPDIASFVSRLFASDSGAFPILAGTLGQPGRGVPLDVRVVNVSRPSEWASTVVFSEGDFELSAIGVPHASAAVVDATTPSVAYRARVGSRSVVFSSDQNGRDTRFLDFARDADVLVMHFATSEEATEAIRAIHATPTVVGRIARQTRPGRLVLSHVIDPPAGYAASLDFSGPSLENNVATVRALYSGPIDVAADLKCFVLE